MRSPQASVVELLQQGIEALLQRRQAVLHPGTDFTNLAHHGRLQIVQPHVQVAGPVGELLAEGLQPCTVGPDRGEQVVEPVGLGQQAVAPLAVTRLVGLGQCGLELALLLLQGFKPGPQMG